MELAAAIAIAIIVALVFFYGFNARSPWETFWPFFVILLLVIWASALWITPIGPQFAGVAWIPLLFIGLMVAFLFAAMPTSRQNKRKTKANIARDNADEPTTRETGATSAISILFWIFVCFLLLAIFVGYFFIPPATIRLILGT
jgi:hypothetical protein